LDKQVSNYVPLVGETVTFTLVIENNGPSDATNIQVLDVVPSGFSYVSGTIAGGDLRNDSDPTGLGLSWIINALPAGASVSLTYDAVVLPAGNYENYAEIYSADQPDSDSTPGNGSSDEDDDDVVIIYPIPVADLGVTKDDGATAYPPGGTITYTIVVSNGGPSNVLGATVSDTIPMQITGWSWTCVEAGGAAGCDPYTGSGNFTDVVDLPVGGTITYTVTATIAPDATGDLVNMVTITPPAGVVDPEPGNDSDEDTDVLPEIAVVKTANPTSIPEPGGLVTFTFQVQNTGTVPLTITSLTDSIFGTLAGDADCQVGTILGVGGSCEFTYTTTINGNAGDTHLNLFTALGEDQYGNPVSDEDDAEVIFTDILPEIEVTKSASPTTIPETGGDVTFTFVVENIGQEDVTLTSLVDSVFGDLNGQGSCAVPQTILVGGSYSCAITVWLEGDDLVPHYNVTTATGEDDDGSSDDDSDDETVVYEDVLPEIEVTKSASPTTIPETGGDVTFTFVVENIGQEDVTLTSLVDSVFGTLAGDADCQVGTILVVGASCSFEAVFTIPPGNYPGEHVNVFTAIGQDDDQNDASDNDDAIVLYTEGTKTVLGTNQPVTPGMNVAIGELVQYQVTLAVRPGEMENVVLTDILDRGLAFVDCEVSGSGSLSSSPVPLDQICQLARTISTEPAGSTNPADTGRKMVLDFGRLSNNGTVDELLTVRYQVVVLDTVENLRGVSLNNQADWTWNGGSLPAFAPPVTIVEPSLGLSKTVTPTEARIGSVVTYRLTLGHLPDSNSDAYDVVLSDLVPGQLIYVPGSLRFVSGQAPTELVDSAAPQLMVRWDVFSNIAGSTIIEFQARVDSMPAGGQIINTASVEWTSLPGDYSDPQSPYNPLSYERFYDPASPVDVYGIQASVPLRVSRVELPDTGFAPYRVTVLEPQPAEKNYRVYSDLWLEIPTLGVSADIVGVPLQDGDWDVSWLNGSVGWLDSTAFPTWKGNSVLTAHVYDATGDPGLFYNLSRLKWGDQVIVHLYGQVYRYEVREVLSVLPNSSAPLRHEEKPWLTLLTCQGYNPKDGNYALRLAVRAVLLSIDDTPVGGSGR